MNSVLFGLTINFDRETARKVLKTTREKALTEEEINKEASEFINQQKIACRELGRDPNDFDWETTELRKKIYLRKHKEDTPLNDLEIENKIDRFETLIREVTEERAEDIAHIPDDVEIKFSYEKESYLGIEARGIQIPLKSLAKKAFNQLGRLVESSTIKWPHTNVLTMPSRVHVENGFHPEVHDELPPLQSVKEFINYALNNVIKEYAQGGPPH